MMSNENKKENTSNDYGFYFWVMYPLLPHLKFDSNVSWLNVFSYFQSGIIWLLLLFVLWVFYKKKQQTSKDWIKKINVNLWVLFIYLFYAITTILYFMLTEFI